MAFVVDDAMIDLIMRAYGILDATKDGVNVPHDSKRGRAKIDIPRETLKLYLSYGFQKSKIAELFSSGCKIGKAITTTNEVFYSMIQFRLPRPHGFSKIHANSRLEVAANQHRNTPPKLS